jgi:UDP-2,3-diacylglucosamine hydrolase
VKGVAFVSDVHLRFGSADYLEQFLRFLRGVPAIACALYIHGDLFDFYIGEKQGRLEFYRPLFDTLRGLVDGGITVGILAGNRDFLLDRSFQDAGVELLPDEVRLDLGGKRTHLSHGDQFCIHDRSYQAARRVLRSGPVRALIRMMPASLAVFLANRYRGISQKKTARMRAADQNRLATILDGVRALLDREAFDYVICGHIHHLAETRVEGSSWPATLFTTGAWEQGPNFVHFDGENLRVRVFEENPRRVPDAPRPVGGRDLGASRPR